MLSHPGVQSVIVILLIRKDRDETRKMVGVDLAEQERCAPLGSTATGHEHGQQQAWCINQQIPLAPGYEVRSWHQVQTEEQLGKALKQSPERRA